MAQVMCFGDSNTYGTPPILDLALHSRFDAATRWPPLMAKEAGVDLIEAGLPGRTTLWEDPVMGAHMNGQTGLKIALESHGPLDLLVIMLGTNDVKARFAATAQQVQGGDVIAAGHCPAPPDASAPRRLSDFGDRPAARA
jgi:lysophospholipase L1-like esterase